MKKIFFIFALSILIIPTTVFSHPGRTDSSGCHTCRTNCLKWGLSSGEYHCHRAKSLPQPKEPVKSHYSETGGYTTPAPEYKQPKQPVKIEQPAKKADQPVVKVETKQIQPTKNTDTKKETSVFKKLLKKIFGW